MEQKAEVEYMADLKAIKETIKENRYKAMVVVNNAMIITYYRVGQIINKRKAWGNLYLDRLAEDLREFGRGYSRDQLKRMQRFANTFSETEMRLQPLSQIPWSSLIEIMNKTSSKEEALWYVNQAYANKWSRTVLLKQFKLKAYQRGIIPAQTNQESFVQDVIKDTLALDFISEKEISREKDLKEKLVNNIIEFLQELGPGFALVGKEYRLVTPTGKNFYIDLLMYHTKVHAYVVIEVKLDEILPADFGQLNFYVNAIDGVEKTDQDNPTVGILLCRNADKYVVETSIHGIRNPIGVSKYKLLEEIPSYLAGKLNEISD